MQEKRVNAARSPEEYDAIVVGSGMTGGWAAKELCEKGLKTLVLERGHDVEHSTDYVHEHTRPWQLAYRGWGDRTLYEQEYPIQKQCYAFGEYTEQYFINDRENPYTHPEDKPFSWIRPNHVGGKSIMWARLCYRWSDLDFEANARDGHGVDWPIRYDDVAPWYDYVEPVVGISGEKLGLAHLPDGQFLPPMPMNCAEEKVRDAVADHFDDRLLTIGRVANLTEPINGRSACQYRSQCERGCSFRAYFSSVGVTLPLAEATGNMTLRPFSVVHSVIYDEEQGRATGVRVIDAQTKEEIEFRGRLIFLCASTLGSTQIMLNSTSRRFPNGIANDSGVLGHYLMDHTMRSGAMGEIPGLEDQAYFGRRPVGVYMPRFRNIDRQTRQSDFVRGYGLQGGAWRESWDRGATTPGIGADFKHSLREPGPWMFSLGGFGETLPRYENYVELDPDVTDIYGIPVLRIHCAWGANEDAMQEDMKVAAAEVLEAAGAKNIRTYRQDPPPGLAIHEMGTARMGRDPKTSVLNGHNQAHDVPNLFVTDGASMASTACQNPSVTFMALTARACNYAVEEMKRGNI